MTQLFCPTCERPTPANILAYFPWLRFARDLFWCSRCKQWFVFSKNSRLRSSIAGMTAVVLVVGALGLYMEINGLTRISGSVIALGFWASILIAHNLAAALVLRRFASLEGPVDHDP